MSVSQVFEYNGERTVGGMTKFIETGGEYGRAPPEEDYDEEVRRAGKRYSTGVQ